MTATEIIIVESRFCGPPDSANGGYICGLLAEHAGLDSAQVTLWRPPPLDRSMHLETNGDGAGRLFERPDDEQPVAEIAPAEPGMEPPTPPAYERACEASAHYAGFERHPFPSCFVCGPSREYSDGMRIFAGPVDGASMVAAAWRPDENLVDDRGHVRPRYLWAALDCPGAFAAISLAGARWPLLLGRFCVRVTGGVQPGEHAVVTGWVLNSEGRKHECGTALYNGDGDPVATARALWIQPRASTR